MLARFAAVAARRSLAKPSSCSAARRMAALRAHLSSGAASATANANPLFDRDALPRFDAIEPAHVQPAITELLEKLEADVGALEAQLGVPTGAVTDADAGVSAGAGAGVGAGSAVGYADVVEALERLEDPVEFAWGAVDHLTTVMNGDELRAAHQALQGPVVQAFTRISQSRAVFEALGRIDVAGLDPAQRRVVEAVHTGMQLGGVGLDGDDKERFNANRVRLSELSTLFSNNVLDATKAFGIVVTDPADIEGLPMSARAVAAQMAAAAGDGDGATAEAGPWKLGFDMPTFGPAMQHLRSRDLRERLYRAYLSRAGDANAPLILEILRLRQENARILGYASHAEVSLVTKMATDVEAVDELTRRLQERARPAAERELAQLTKFAKANGFEDDELSLWDVAFWSERQSEQLFGFEEEELRPYFALPNVLDGLFSLCKRLFGVDIVAADGEAPVWHEDVRFFHVKDEADGAHVASFFLDPYSRPETKRGGAWMDRCVNRSRVLDRKPVAYLVCNGSPPVGATPSLMSFSDVTTLFHEAGHGLQHMLTAVPHAAAAGINNIEWDAVELPSQFMENWCYDRKTVIDSGLAVHHETGEPLPLELFEKLREQQKYQAGMMLLRQLFMGKLDMELHHSFDPEAAGDDPAAIFKFQKEVQRAGYSLLPPLPEDRTLCSFLHIFAGGYSAGYYSYKWAEVLSADAFAAFEEAGLDDEAAVQETGRRFRDTVLAMGGGAAPAEVFRAFRGKDASPDALLSHQGLL